VLRGASKRPLSSKNVPREVQIVRALEGLCNDVSRRTQDGGAAESAVGNTCAWITSSTGGLRGRRPTSSSHRYRGSKREGGSAPSSCRRSST